MGCPTWAEAVVSGAPPPRIEREGDLMVVWLAGNLDITTARDVSRAVATAIGRDDIDVVVDLSGVSFLDAATIRVLYRARTFLTARARSFSVRAPSACASRVLAVCGLADLIEVVSSQPNPAPERFVTMRGARPLARPAQEPRVRRPQTTPVAALATAKSR